MFARREFLLRAFETLDVCEVLSAFGIAIVVPYDEMARTLSFSTFLHMRVEIRNLFIFLGLGTAWHLFAAPAAGVGLRGLRCGQGLSSIQREAGDYVPVAGDCRRDTSFDR